MRATISFEQTKSPISGYGSAKAARVIALALVASVLFSCDQSSTSPKATSDIVIRSPEEHLRDKAAACVEEKEEALQKIISRDRALALSMGREPTPEGALLPLLKNDCAT